MNTPATFEWYLKTFYNLNINDVPDDQVDKYRTEFEIWKDASGKDKKKMWPIRTNYFEDIEEYNEV